MINRASEKNKGQKYKSDLFFIEHFTFFKKHSTYLHFFLCYYDRPHMQLAEYVLKTIHFSFLIQLVIKREKNMDS